MLYITKMLILFLMQDRHQISFSIVTIDMEEQLKKVNEYE